MPDNSERIAEIQEILRSGATSVTNDGHSVTRDLEFLRTELRQLQLEDDTQRRRRPVMLRAKIGGV